MGAVAQSVVRIKRLVDLIRPDGWQTFIGSPSAVEIPPAYIAVAYGGDDRPGVTGQASMAESYEPNASGHTWWVNCTASAYTGDVQPLQRLIDVEDVFDAFETVLAANRYLPDDNGSPLLVGGSFAQLAQHDWQIEPDGNVGTVFW